MFVLQKQGVFYISEGTPNQYNFDGYLGAYKYSIRLVFDDILNNDGFLINYRELGTFIASLSFKGSSEQMQRLLYREVTTFIYEHDDVFAPLLGYSCTISVPPSKADESCNVTPAFTTLYKFPGVVSRITKPIIAQLLTQ